MEKKIDDIVLWLREKVKAAGAKGIIFGLSGGIDSAVVAGIAMKSFPKDSLGVIMPCHSNEEDEIHGRLVSDRLGLATKKVDLTSTYETLLESLDFSSDSRLALANIKPRLRMTSLYYLAQELNYLVVGPTNKSEFVLGYYTKHGDSGVDLLPIASFSKRDIFKMAETLNIPREIIDKKPSAGLWNKQTDEEEMGFSYEELDRYIEDGKGTDEFKNKVDAMYERAEHKRKFPDIYIPNRKS